jgi:uncharacterized protein YutE (UPF0331/DUF86 family)
MTDRELVAKKLALIETCLSELRTLARPEAIRTDVREERFVEHTLQLAIQAALDVASHIVSDERLGEPETNRELFSLLRRAGSSTTLVGQASGDGGLPQRPRARYQGVDLDIVRDVLEHRLDDLVAFVEAVRRRLG